MNTQQLRRRMRSLLLGGVVTALTLAMGMSSAFGQEEETPQMEPQEPQVQAQEQEQMQVRDQINRVHLDHWAQYYTDFVEGHQIDERWKQDLEQYTMRGLNRLAFTLSKFVPERDTELKQRYQSLHEQIHQLRQTDAEERETAQVREAFTNVTDYFQNVQQRYYPQYSQAAQELGQKLEAIDAEQSIEDQGDAINEYFVSTAMTIEQMALAPTEVGVGGGPVEEQPEMDQPATEDEHGVEEEPELEGPEIEEPEIEGPEVEEEPELEGPEFEEEPQDEPSEDLEN